MEFDKIKWNEKHALKKGHHQPDGFLELNLSLLKKGRGLDVACGRGRNAFLLAQNGFQTLGVDYSDVGLDILRKTANALDLNIQTRAADLDQPDFLLEEKPFDSIICINFKPKEALLELIPKLLVQDGIFLMCSFNDLQTLQTPFPLEKALLENEFVHYWPDFITLTYTSFKDETGERDGYIFRKK